jgi:hypothetical protein
MVSFQIVMANKGQQYTQGIKNANIEYQLSLLSYGHIYAMVAK